MTSTKFVRYRSIISSASPKRNAAVLFFSLFCFVVLCFLERADFAFFLAMYVAVNSLCFLRLCRFAHERRFCCASFHTKMVVHPVYRFVLFLSASRVLVQSLPRFLATRDTASWTVSAVASAFHPSLVLFVVSFFPHTRTHTLSLSRYLSGLFDHFDFRRVPSKTLSFTHLA